MNRLALIAGALAGLAAVASAQTGRNVAEYNLGSDKLAIQGYDPVAYFDDGGGTARKGKESITAEHGGVVYRFATEANRERFVASPEVFEPTHGGWCAYAMSKNIKYEIDPEAFRIGEGRLLLFADADYAEHDGDWVPVEHESLKRADANWKTMSGESPRKVPSTSWRPTAEWNLSGVSLAIEGYDPVSYFPEGGSEPTKGNARFSASHRGILYRFANQENLEAFRADPAKYEPAHGGWCSYAMGLKGDKVEVDPEAFRLTNGQLHLFYNSWFSDTREDWDEDTANLKRKADANWMELVDSAKSEG